MAIIETLIDKFIWCVYVIPPGMTACNDCVDQLFGSSNFHSLSCRAHSISVDYAKDCVLLRRLNASKIQTFPCS